MATLSRARSRARRFPRSRAASSSACCGAEASRASPRRLAVPLSASGPRPNPFEFFGNVCELDLVFNFNKVYMILDEFFLAGEVQATSKQASLRRVQELDKAD